MKRILVRSLRPGSDMHEKLPLSRIFDLADLSDAGFETVITAAPGERAVLAQWEEVPSVERFEARVALKRLSQSRFDYRAELAVDLTQNCVVTLEPVESHIAREFRRELHYVPNHSAKKGGEITIGAAEDDTPEVIESLRFDLAGPLLEELSLAIEPYPRAPGVVFEAPPDAGDVRESPFAVLKGLKRG